MMLAMHRTIVVMAMAIAALSTTAHAAISFTYSYDDVTKNNVLINGEPYSDLTNGELADGVIATTDVPWDENGAIFKIATDPLGSLPQPGLTLNLGGEYDLASLTIYYVVRQGSGVYAPGSVDILVDNVAVPQFTAFDNSEWSPGNVNRSVNVDLTGYTGSTIHLDFRTGKEWLGLSEIVVSEVPEPASLALIGLGGLLVLSRRKR